MIELPRRSVTRFFVPLIDVLILLFCIFLLMPYVQTPETSQREPARPEPPADAEQWARDVEALRRERDRLIDERARALDRLAIRVLEVDPATGRLYDSDPQRVEVASAADAQNLIDRHKRATAGRDVYFLLLLPRAASGYPLEKQVAAYARWFQDVPHGFDNPRGQD